MTRRKLQLLGTVALVAMWVSGCWGQVGYDPGHTRFNLNETTLTAANVATLEPEWSVELADRASEPMVRSGRVFLTTWVEGRTLDVRSLLVADGTTQWNRRFVDLAAANPFDATAATFVGGEVWAAWVGIQFGGPVPLGGFAVERLDPDDGATIATEQNQKLVASPAIDVAGSVVQNWYDLNSQHQHVVVRDAATLSVSWRATFPRPLAGKPLAYPTAVADGRVFVVDHTGVLHMFPLAGCGAETCSPAWSHDIGIAAAQAQPLAIGGQVFVAAGTPGNPDAGNNDLTALDGATGAVNWGAGLAGVGNFVQRDLAATTDTIYGTVANILSAYAVDEVCPGGAGCLEWQAQLPAAATASPVVAGQVVYVGVPGEIRAYAAAGCGTPPCTPVATFAVDGTPDHVVVAAGKLVVVHRPAADALARLTAFAPAA